jgi:hypothetical protein
MLTFLPQYILEWADFDILLQIIKRSKVQVSIYCDMERFWLANYPLILRMCMFYRVGSQFRLHLMSKFVKISNFQNFDHRGPSELTSKHIFGIGNQIRK